MKKFEVTYDHTVYRPSNYDIFIKQQAFNVIVEAESLALAEEKFKKQYNKNPFYFKFKEI